MRKRSLLGYRFDELCAIVEKAGGKKYSAKQVWSWLYKKGITDIDLMSDLPLKLRNGMRSEFCILPVSIDSAAKSADGTEKLLIKLYDDNFVECVIIPEKERLTLCISSQAGCRFNCSFCATGKSGFKRDLEASEIVGQVIAASEFCGKRITNVVYMGMGEPFDNYDEVIKSTDIISDDSGLAIGKRKITISTFGHIDGLKKYIAEDVRYKLAVSLHNPFDNERSRLMPGNRIYPLKELFQVLKEYARRSNRKVVFEYILMKGVNDSERHAEELKKLLSTLPSKLNLIKYHGISEGGFTPLSDEFSLKFYRYFSKSDFPVVFRTSRGEDIAAACGQLSAAKITEKPL
ncbi:MAG: 23S rRNA (adenine(2503)-C(2))-methyltransferase RlmN [Candidatus Delongbacteria bacterium]